MSLGSCLLLTVTKQRLYRRGWKQRGLTAAGFDPNGGRCDLNRCMAL
jgi:hypothetical protein